MRRIKTLSILAVVSIFLSISCIFSVALAELRGDCPNLSTQGKGIEVYMKGDSPDRDTRTVGRVSASSCAVESAMDLLKNQARKLGGDAIVNVQTECKSSPGSSQDLYFLKGEVVVWE